RSAGSSAPLLNATRSRTSIGAVRWFSPTTTMPRSTSVGLAVLAEPERVQSRREDDQREAEDGERRRAPPAPSGADPALQQDHVDAPRDQREHQRGIERPRGRGDPGVMRPDDPGHDAEREQDEAPDEAGVVEAIERLEGGKIAEKA